MRPALRRAFSEESVLYTLFGISLAAHLVIFFAMLWLYGPCVFFLSSDCSTNNNDTQHYVVIADNLAHGHGYSRFADPPYEPDALRTPLLPFYFAPFAYFGGLSNIWLAILLLNLLLALAPVVIYKLARFFLSHTLATVAGIFMAAEPLYLYRSQIAEPDALFVLLFTAALYFLVRSWKEGGMRDVFFCAILLGFSILAKPSAEYIAILVVIFEGIYMLFFVQMQWSERAKHCGILLLIPAFIVSPWLVRNKLVFGNAQLSSIQAYNLYEYYTKNIPLPDEHVPETMQRGSREPSRYLPNQTYFTSVALARIKAHLSEYFKEHLMGSFRNLFVSDIADIYYYGHTKLLPFRYTPESHLSVHDALRRGDLVGVIAASLKALPKLLWAAILFLVYILCVAGWIISWRRDRTIFLGFTLFLALYAYLLISSGPYVDAKYRLPGLLPIIIVSLYGFSWLHRQFILRTSVK